MPIAISPRIFQRSLQAIDELKDLSAFLLTKENALKLNFSLLRKNEIESRIFSRLLKFTGNFEVFISSEYENLNKSSSEINQTMVFCTDTSLKQFFFKLPEMLASIAEQPALALKFARSDQLLSFLAHLFVEALSFYLPRGYLLVEKFLLVLLNAETEPKEKRPGSAISPVESLLEILAGNEASLLSCLKAAKRVLAGQMLADKSEVEDRAFETYLAKTVKHFPFEIRRLLALLYKFKERETERTGLRLAVAFLRSLTRKLVHSAEKLFFVLGFDQSSAFDKNSARILLENFFHFLEPENKKVQMEVARAIKKLNPDLFAAERFGVSQSTPAGKNSPYMLFSVDKEELIAMIKFALEAEGLFPAEEARKLAENIGFYHLETIEVFVKSSEVANAAPKIEGFSEFWPKLLALNGRVKELRGSAKSLLELLQGLGLLPSEFFDSLLDKIYIVGPRKQKGLLADKCLVEEVLFELKREAEVCRQRLGFIKYLESKIELSKARFINASRFRALANKSIASKKICSIFRASSADTFLKFQSDSKDGELKSLQIVRGSKAKVIRDSKIYDENYGIREMGVEYLEIRRFKDLLVFLVRQGALLSALKSQKFEESVQMAIAEFFEESQKIVEHLDLDKRFGINAGEFKALMEEFVFGEMIVFLHKANGVLTRKFKLPAVAEIKQLFPLPQHAEIILSQIEKSTEEKLQLAKKFSFDKFRKILKHKQLKKFFIGFVLKLKIFADENLGIKLANTKVILKDECDFVAEHPFFT